LLLSFSVFYFYFDLFRGKMSSMEALRPTKQIVSVLRKHGRMNRRVLWEHLVEEQTSSYPHPDFAQFH
jgi:hypothetical protein